ncbi:MAG: hypothetical protein GTN38_01645 [Candidatus Aenigmarchaeota archaeon]|nr:hypothetical protein [Candidatus Aenigmarchaeota archaeon]NIQ17283.1 hypothetical protein [Candidatus Aenigmarchaeota archaeon]NIS73144.1 hypothetical protein [Candidatus Aenigmarchaeota archaeon]
MGKKILATSFDGVINHSINECCLVSLNAYNGINPDSFFRRPIEPKEIKLVKNTLVLRGFTMLRPLVSIAEDYLVVLKLIEQDVDGVYELLISESKEKLNPFLREFEKMKNEISKDVLKNFNQKFYQERKRLREDDLESWFNLQEPIEENIKELRKLSKEGFTIYITTSKDKESCSLLLDKYGLDFVKKENILSKGDGDIKKKIDLISKKESIPPENIFLINDILHSDLGEIKKNGIQVFLIKGGYSFQSDSDKAKEKGIKILERGNFASVLKN